MRKIFFVFFVFALMLGGVSMTVYATDCGRVTPIDQAGDWLATLGKQGMEKNQVLAKRKADRLAACTKKQSEESAEAAKKAGNDMKKKLGF